MKVVKLSGDRVGGGIKVESLALLCFFFFFLFFSAGLNGNPVCMVNDDWYISSPLCPHPLIASQVPRSYTGPLPTCPIGFRPQQFGSKTGTGEAVAL